MVDIPVTTEDASGIIIYGVESEQIEEENDAYNESGAWSEYVLLIILKIGKIEVLCLTEVRYTHVSSVIRVHLGKVMVLGGWDD